MLCLPSPPTPAGLLPRPSQTHESYMAAVQRLAIDWLAPESNSTERRMMQRTRFGFARTTERGLLGIAEPRSWTPNGESEPLTFISVYMHPDTEPCLIAYTVIHELGHALQFYRQNFDGHGPTFRVAATQLGLVNPVATYRGKGSITWAEFAPGLRESLESIPIPTDGRGATGGYGTLIPPIPTDSPIKVCRAGVGVRGGTSRGKGSGSRTIKHVCGCHAGQPSQLTGETLTGQHVIYAAATTGGPSGIAALCQHSGTVFRLASQDSPSPSPDQGEDSGVAPGIQPAAPAPAPSGASGRRPAKGKGVQGSRNHKKPEPLNPGRGPQKPDTGKESDIQRPLTDPTDIFDAMRRSINPKGSGNTGKGMDILRGIAKGNKPKESGA